jgi:ectoine hydroxylase-related dioxygenase (phytanoyl-CoA dioxygenase family)
MKMPSECQTEHNCSNADGDKIDAWVDDFNRDGFLIVREVIPPDWIEELREDLDRALEGQEKPGEDDNKGILLQSRMFEHSAANLRLFDREPIVSFAEKVLGTNCHVMHNNSFRTYPGGGISGWHQDDSPHYLVTHGEPPDNVLLPCLLFTMNLYLTDVPDATYGPTECVRGSHLLGRPCPADPRDSPWSDRIVPGSGAAGDAVIFNNQVWHHGGPNMSDRVRYITQVSYARRIIGHKYYPFMNYVMPEHIYAHAGKRLKRLLGFLPRGAYG